MIESGIGSQSHDFVFAAVPLEGEIRNCSVSFEIYHNIYIFIAIALDETSILVAVHFSMKNIYQSCDLGRAIGQSKVYVSQ